MMKEVSITKHILLLLALFCLPFCLQGQEVNMKITINSDKIQLTDKSVFTSLEDILNRYVNNRKWTNTTFSVNERIDCTLLLVINELTDQNLYVGELQLTATRPVYNSAYITPIFNFKDNEFDFYYLQGEFLEFSENNLSNNLMATIGYYIYIILGLDFDSYSLHGGKPYFEKAMNIANDAQSLGAKGWAPFGSNNNRYALASAFTDEQSSFFHTLWYNYHRKGLDEMATNAARGRNEIESVVPVLEQIYKARSSSPILTFFADTKLDELVNVYSESKSDDKQAAYKILQSIYPTRKSILDKIKK